MSFLATTLESLSRQSTGVPFEVVVVVDRADEQKAESICRGSTLAFRIDKSPGEGAAAARNMGIEAAQGRLLVFLDSDVEADPGLLDVYWQALETAGSPSRVVLLGRIDQIDVARGWVARSYADGWRRHYSSLAEGRSATWRDLYSGNFAVEAASFAEVGGFDTSLSAAEDVEMGWRLAAGGHSFRYLDDAQVLHLDRKSGRQVRASFTASGSGQASMALKHADLMKDTAREYHDATALERTLRHLVLHPGGLPLLTLVLRSIAAFRPRQPKLFSLLARTYQWSGVKMRLRAAGSGFWRDLTAGIPCLMYHAFTLDQERPSRFVVDSSAVRAQLQWLHRQSYRLLTVREVAEGRDQGELFDARRTVVLTIDDGYAEVIDTVAPGLEQLGQKATLLLATGSVGEENNWDADGPLAGRQILSWQQVRTWAENGNEVGNHTVSHKSLDAIPHDEAKAEVTRSIEDLERELGIRPSTFSLPYGNPAADLEALEPFDAVLSAEEGLNHPAVPMTQVRRTEICGGDGLLTFRLKLRLGYNQVDPLSLLRRLKRSLVPPR